MFSGWRISSFKSSSVGVQASCSSSAEVRAGIRCPDWLEMVTPTPPGAMTFPTSSSRTAVPYRSTFRMASMGAWLGETPAAFTSFVTGPYFCASAMSFRIDSREERSISSASVSNPASFMIPEMILAFSIFLSPMTIFIPYPVRRAIAMPICPAPVKIITFFICVIPPSGTVPLIRADYVFFYLHP